MIATIKNPTMSNLREAVYSLISRNVFPIEVWVGEGFVTDGGRTFVGIIGEEHWNKLAPKLDAESFTVSASLGLILRKSSAVSGAVIWGKNANPNQIVEID